MESSPSHNKAIIGVIVIALLVIAATAVIVMGANSNESTDSATDGESSTSPSVSATAESSVSKGTSSFKDGTYSATGSYQTPGGRESIGVSVTIGGDTITDATVTQNATGGEAEEFQDKFASSFKSQVVGKKITDVSLSRVAGSSLTPIGFNNAVKDIQNQAKA